MKRAIVKAVVAGLVMFIFSIVGGVLWAMHNFPIEYLQQENVLFHRAILYSFPVWSMIVIILMGRRFFTIDVSFTSIALRYAFIWAPAGLGWYVTIKTGIVPVYLVLFPLSSVTLCYAMIAADSRRRKRLATTS